MIGKSKRSQALFVDSEYHRKSSHYGFAFTTRNVSDLFNFTYLELKFRLLNNKKDEKGIEQVKKLIEDFRLLATKV